MGNVVINIEYCKGCQICTTACAKKLLTLGKRFNTNGYYYIEFADEKGECTGCALCAEMCPDAALEVWNESAASSRSFDKLMMVSEVEP